VVPDERIRVSRSSIDLTPDPASARSIPPRLRGRRVGANDRGPHAHQGCDPLASPKAVEGTALSDPAGSAASPPWDAGSPAEQGPLALGCWPGKKGTGRGNLRPDGRNRREVRMKRIVVALAMLAVVALAAPAAAQEPPQGVPYVQYFMDPEFVEGTLIRPDDLTLIDRGRLITTSLIKIRWDFVQELLKNGEDL
jgi:hypothetical protein